MTQAIQLTLMTVDEARACIDQIKSNLETVREQLYWLREREGWKALEYPSFRDCITAEFAMSESMAHRLCNAHMVDRILTAPWQESSAFFGKNATPGDSPNGESQPVANIPEAHARELAPLLKSPEALRAVHADVQERTQGKPAAADYREAVERAAAPLAEEYKAFLLDHYSCDDCGSSGFSLEVWHCPVCAHHWSTDGDDLCNNCLSVGDYTYRPGFAPDPDDEFAGGPRVGRPAPFVMPEMERESEEERAYYALARQRLIVRLAPEHVADAATHPDAALPGFEELEAWLSLFMARLRANAATPVRAVQ